jgi:hypothetical protein
VVVTIFHEVGVPVEDAQDLDAVPAKRGSGSRDDRVGRRCGAAGEKNADALDRPLR